MNPYWLNTPLIIGSSDSPKSQYDVVVIGSGLSGVSAGYFLQEKGFQNILIVDDEPQKAASFRNAGHILHGTVESMKALQEIHGKEAARDIWSFSVQICEEVKKTIQKLNCQADYKQDGYLVISISEVEDQECQESVRVLNEMDFSSEYWAKEKVQSLGFKNVFGARYEPGSASAHPVKFRNGVLQSYLDNGGHYHSGFSVKSIEASSQGVLIKGQDKEVFAEASVIAANAYSPLFSDFFASRNLVDPFRGQIIASKPLKHQFQIRYPHSFDHGYEYALVTNDNRLLIGGWRDHSTTKEVGTYSLEVNEFIESGLKNFVQEHYDIEEEINWDYSWSGIMAASKTGFPFIGPTNHERVFACCGFTGHGFSWAHGSAKLLTDIIFGNQTPEVAKYFNPKFQV